MTTKAFVLKPQLVCNGRSFSITALGDTGAQGFVYINTPLVVQLHRNSGVYVEKLDKPIPVKGYDGHPGTPITHFVRFTLYLDGRRQLQIPMMITDLGQYDLILGRDWFDHFQVLADCHKNRLIWPDEVSLIDESLQRVSHAKIFTKLDIRQGFHRIRLHPDAEDLSTFRTRYGSFKYKVMPFGMTNAPATFQRFINTTLAEYLDDFATAYVDDILIFSETIEEHVEHVRKVLQRLREAGLQASINKCEFHVQNTKFLGFIVSTDGIAVDPAKVAVIKNWEAPTTVRGVQSFLGFCNFYRRFIERYSHICRPLHQLTRKEVLFKWSPECQAAFDTLKINLASAPILRHYDPEAETKVETDASEGCTGAVLHQRSSPTLPWHPVAFLSKSMDPAERNYDTGDQEMLAIVRALTEWRPELEGLQRMERFVIYSDHGPLQAFMTTKKLNGRQSRWQEFLSRFYFVIHHKPGKHNIIADILSQKELSPARIEQPSLLKPEMLGPSPFTVALITMAPLTIQPITDPGNTDNLTDNVVERVLSANKTHPSLDKYRIQAADEDETQWTVENEQLLFEGRLVVPDEGDLRARLLDEIHRQPMTAHPGSGKMLKLVGSRYYWVGWSADVKRYIDNCLTCKRTKVWHDKPPGLLQPLPIPDRPGQHHSMDFRSFEKDRHGYDAVLVFVDRLTKRPISIPCHKTTTAEQTAQFFIRFVMPWLGIPDTIVSDRGPQFMAVFWQEFSRILGIKHKPSTAYHPQTDGQTENANKQQAQRLRVLVNYQQDNWSEYLPIVDYAAATLPQDSTGQSPFFTEKGFDAKMSFDWITDVPEVITDEAQRARDMMSQIQQVWKTARESIEEAQKDQKRYADTRRRKDDFKVHDLVFVTAKLWKTDRPNRKLSHQAYGPFEIIEKIGNAWKLQLPDSMKVHPVFAPEKLRHAAHSKPLTGQIPDAEPPVVVNDQEEFEVDEIEDSRLYYRRLQYRASWIGNEDTNWYPAGDFKNAPEKLAAFHLRYPAKPGPSMRLPIWLDAAKNDEFVDDHEDDNKPMTK
ncbi:gag/polymerase/env polyprotein [Penicillium cosmopolitanum]|uniref:Gag/polymerase/env polyprotein n=1 Tax=Penicillium cosmopolitanum TaxID=1131564 RepID=A0A9X0BE82_9EURO|nr:gag/polymerase/env polyprotein [Penicillium cosmopolitanum]KAJ5413808.1 gag/polymerase/env polyprotein [Penicillium cosmopolitanum]